MRSKVLAIHFRLFSSTLIHNNNENQPWIPAEWTHINEHNTSSIVNTWCGIWIAFITASISTSAAVSTIVAATARQSSNSSKRTGIGISCTAHYSKNTDKYLKLYRKQISIFFTFFFYLFESFLFSNKNVHFVNISQKSLHLIAEKFANTNTHLHGFLNCRCYSLDKRQFTDDLEHTFALFYTINFHCKFI